MGEFSSLCITSLVMFLGCYAFGMIPFISSSRPSGSRKVTIFGSGLLLGASLGVIIPESMRESHAKLAENRTAMSESHHGAVVGVMLISGYVSMFLMESASFLFSSSKAGKSWMTTGAMCVHSISEGMALSVAILNGNLKLQYTFLVAILIHKGPASLALVALLLDQNLLNRSEIRRHLLLFSLASPAAAIMFYAAWWLGALNVVAGNPMLSSLLIYGAGTLLYIACRSVKPEIFELVCEIPVQSVTNAAPRGLPSVLFSVTLFISGCLLPVFASMFHLH